MELKEKEHLLLKQFLKLSSILEWNQKLEEWKWFIRVIRLIILYDSESRLSWKNEWISIVYWF